MKRRSDLLQKKVVIAMKKELLLIVVGMLCWLAAGNLLAEMEYVADEILVKFKSENISTQEYSCEQLIFELNARKIRKFNINNVYHLQIALSTDISSIINELNSRPEIEYAEPNYKVYAYQTPNDPLYNQLWGLEKIQAPAAWDITTGSSDIIVAVIDTGVDYTHEDLNGNIWVNPNEVANNGIDDDKNGYVDDIHGWDFPNGDNDPFDDNSHGSHCSGTIAGVANNGVGVAGISWQTKIMALKFMTGDGYGSTSDAIQAIEYATSNGAKVLSNSWGGPGYSQAIADAITASHQAGAIFVAAAGNESTDNDSSPLYPASYDVANIISVAASDQNDNLASFSCYGKTSVDLAAPGVSILSSTPGNQYDSYDGTSMACPHVAGACALVWAAHPEWSNLEVIYSILNSVDQGSSFQDKTVTGGRLNVYQALQVENPTPPDPSPPPDPVDGPVIFFDDMENGANGWSTIGDDGWGGSALWHQSLRRSASSNTAWYYGMEASGNYDTWSTNYGAIISPAISLTENVGGGQCTLTFNHWREVENYTESCDTTYILISSDQGNNWDTVWHKDATSPSASSWKTETVSLSQYIGREILIAFCFDTLDYYDNYYEGWYIDDVTVTGSQAAPPPPPPTNPVSHTVWYLAEGTTIGSFDEWILIMNPSNQTANVLVTFMLEDGNPIQRGINIPGTSRYTIHVNDIVPNAAVATKIESTNEIGIIAERSMYWNVGDQTWAGGHNSLGVTAPANSWYLAEGSTAGFDEWVLLMNPNNQPAEVAVTFMLPDGNTVRTDITIGPTSRYTIHVNDIISQAAVATKAETTNGVSLIAERSMYWNTNNEAWVDGHNSCGVTAAALNWYLAEGSTDGFDEWILIMNPNNQQAAVEVIFMLPDGNTKTENITLAPTSRHSIYVNEIVANSAVATKVAVLNNVPVIAERSMYWQGLAGGHNSCGVTETAASWYLAEGCTAGFDEWVLIMNPHSQAAEVTVTFMLEDGSNIQRELTLAGTSRTSIHVNEIAPDKSVATKAESTNNIGIIAERAMYWNVGNQTWASGHNSIGVQE